METQTKKSGNKLVIYTLFATTAILWGMSFLWTKVALAELEVVELLAVRWTLAAALFGVLIACKVVKVNFKGKSRKYLLIGAFVQPCLYALLETWGVDFTTSSVSSIFIAVIPLVVVILDALIFRAKVSKKTTFAIILAFSGVVVSVALAPDFAVGGRMIGYLCLILAVLAGGVYSIFANKVGQEYSPIEFTFTMAVMASVWFNALSLIQGNGFGAYAVTFSGGGIALAVIMLGVGCSFGAYLMYNYTLSRLPAELASCIQANSTTAIGVIAGIALGGDTWGWYTVLGLGMTIAGVVISSFDVE